MKNIDILFIELFLLMICIGSVSANMFNETCSTNPSAYLLYDDFEDATINSSIWSIFPNAQLSNLTSYSGNQSVECSFSGGSYPCLETLSKILGNDTSIQAYISRTDNITEIIYGISLGRNYMNTLFNVDGINSYNYGYYSASLSWFDLGLLATDNIYSWDRIYMRPIAITNIMFNITNYLGNNINVFLNSAGGSVISFPSNVSFVGTVTTNYFYIDKIMMWNNTIYGDFCPPAQPIQLSKSQIIAGCNQSYTKDLANIFYTNITLNWSVVPSALDYTLNYTDLLFDYNVCETTNLSCTTNTNLLTSGRKYFYVVASNGYDNSSVSDFNDCYIDICTNNWIKTPQPCLTGIRLVNYYDDNNCTIKYNIPISNGTYEDCNTVIYNQTVYSEDVTILIILFLFLIISLICAIFVHEGFFGLCALILSIMMWTFINYKYPTMLMYISIFMIILFAVMWIVIGRIKRT